MPRIGAVAIAAVLAVAVVAVVLSAGSSKTRPTDLADGSEGSRSGTQADVLPPVCESRSDVACHVAPNGALVLLKMGDKERPRDLTLVALGGPGSDVGEVLEYLPTWTAKRNLVAFPEPWAYQTDAFCAAYPCPPDGGLITDSAAWAQEALGRIRRIYAFSFGATEVLPLLSAREFERAKVWLVAPAPLPGTSGEQVGTLRLEATLSTMARLACRQRGESCAASAVERLRAVAAGRAGLDEQQSTLGLLSLGTVADGNIPAIRALAIGAQGSVLKPKSVRLLREGAFQFTLSGKDEATMRRREGYQAAMCRTYAWPAASASPFVAMHQCPTSELATTSTPAIRNPARVILGINAHDPVVNIEFQREWLEIARAAVVVRFRSDRHSMGSASKLHP